MEIGGLMNPILRAILQVSFLICALVIVLPGVVFADKFVDLNSQTGGILHRPERSNPYLATVQTLKSHQWSDADDPRLIMDYSEALVETDAEVPGELKGKTPIIFRFALAYHDLLRGETKESKQIFSALRDDKAGMLFGYVGLLELAKYTGNIMSMEPLLHELKRDITGGMFAPKWVLPYFEATYDLNVGKYDEVAEMIRNAQVREALDQNMVNELQVPLLLRQNHLREARTQLAHSAQTQDSIIAGADIIAAKDGYEVSSKLLKKKMLQFPLMRKVAEAYVYHSLEVVHFDYKLSVPYLNILVALQQKKTYDVPLKLGLANALFDTGDPLKILRTTELLSELHYADDFLFYDLMAAKLALFAKNPVDYKKYMKRAKEKAPLNVAVLWFSYQVAEREKDYGAALKDLEELLRTEPNNVFYLTAKAKTYAKLGRKNEAQNVVKQIMDSKRYFATYQRDELRNIVR